jgi:hypothetical protein
VSDYRSVRVTSSQATGLPRAPRGKAETQNERSYALVVASLTLASTTIALFDLYLLAASAN